MNATAMLDAHRVHERIAIECRRDMITSFGKRDASNAFVDLLEDLSKD
jgi:hypothetical protein